MGDDPALFEREARITGRLEHPGIVPIYGLGRDQHGAPVYAMRMIRGGTLGDAIEAYHRGLKSGATSDSKLPLRSLLQHFLAVCQAVAYAHSQKVVHRDIKPANIMLGEYGETLLVDWGLAKEYAECEPEASEACGAVPTSTVLNSNDEGNHPLSALEPLSPAAATRIERQDSTDRTAMGVVKGSPGYMSPEQAEGRVLDVGPGTDIYSLGATLFAILTGRPPFQGREPLKVVQQVRTGSFPAPRSLLPSIPRPLEAVCLKAMRFAVRDRYTSALEIARDIEHFLADEPIAAWREPPHLRLARWTRRNRKLATVFVASLLILGGILLTSAWILRSERARRQDSAKQEDAAD
ncbi:MAG TPA: serine/threonine-protein kinase, partial [Pirellulaceae bacterium]